MGGNDDDDDLISEFKPPGNDFFYDRAARLSCWSKQDADDLQEQIQIIDGHSSDQSADVSIRRLSDADSFTGKSQRSNSNSIAGMSRGSFSSQGSKGIRNFLGSKFQKRKETIKKAENLAASQKLASSGRAKAFTVPGQAAIMGTKSSQLPKGEVILEDIDSDIDGSDISQLNYNYDVINLKDE
mmetsp:Transcript_44174/g.58632  ORF Transcript_44174/g.58632 Transcript_44174/m.58632 type:complete len:184 (+) Transcript_44174:1647-2198(+)|eukprot:CAMPEP_0185570678 /NCGR_PEP_ID=MMETSP0434-20130131/2907_1 /TAXON_ID=626734 ORGANISM="Favella taraikaensis, Strain Fe Narragansett Bay" /NCGR_SAMPLE_ID=MMETSP0434 /ASSEMBLY_ACC=CAM_ASM_000379 /LENGTH=183 /DNA_ID=CAMNT_0028185867 /DNA_START=1567 /DNA_END=2118 /DNA_ORIENTATION=-